MKKRMIPGWAIFILLFTLLFCANAEEEEKSRQYVLFSWEREMFSPEEETLDLHVAPLRAADRMALTTPDRPALMPAFRPAIALVPMDFRLVAVRLRETAFFTLAETVVPALLMS